MQLWCCDFGAIAPKHIFLMVLGLFHRRDIAAVGLGKGIAVGDVGLDVQHWGLVEQVDASDPEDIAINGQEAQGTEADRVGAVGGAGGQGAAFGAGARGGVTVGFQWWLRWSQVIAQM